MCSAICVNSTSSIARAMCIVGDVAQRELKSAAAEAMVTVGSSGGFSRRWLSMIRCHDRPARSDSRQGALERRSNELARQPMIAGAVSNPDLVPQEAKALRGVGNGSLQMKPFARRRTRPVHRSPLTPTPVFISRRNVTNQEDAGAAYPSPRSSGSETSERKSASMDQWPAWLLANWPAQFRATTICGALLSDAGTLRRKCVPSRLGT